MEFDFDIMDIIDNEEYEEVITPNRPYLKEYGRGLKRRNDWKKAKRKENIVKHIYLTSDDFIRPRHWYSKNKVHCSCQLCRFRSVFNPNAKTYSDMKKELSMEAKLNEYYKEVI